MASLGTTDIGRWIAVGLFLRWEPDPCTAVGESTMSTLHGRPSSRGGGTVNNTSSSSSPPPVGSNDSGNNLSFKVHTNSIKGASVGRFGGTDANTATALYVHALNLMGSYYSMKNMGKLTN